MTQEQVLEVLAKYRSDLTLEDWKEADMVTVLSWLLEQETKPYRRALQEIVDIMENCNGTIGDMANVAQQALENGK